MQIRIQSSERKKFIQETSEKKEIEMVFLDKDSSRQFNQVREQIMKAALRKQSHPSLSRNKSSANNFQRQVNVKEFKTHMSDHGRSPEQKNKESQKEASQHVSIKESQQKIVEEHVKKIPYKFSYKSLAIELVVAYSVTLAVLYFITLSSSFPFFELILVIAFAASIQPWRSSNILMFIALGIIIGNYFLSLSIFTYPSIIICYYAVMVFNQKHKRKQVFVLVLIFTMVFGFIVMPSIFSNLDNQNKSIVFPYIFPILMLLLRTVVSCSYLFIDHTATIFLQLPLFLSGLQYGVILTYELQSIEFWYLLVTFSLQIINDRTRFLTKMLVSIVKNCNKSKLEQSEKIKPKERQYPVLPAHANGYACLHSFHLFILVYIYSKTGFYTAPFSNSNFMNTNYLNPSYKPVIVWLLTSVYEIMSILLTKNKKNIMFFGFISNKWWRCVLRGFLLSLGMWAFYLGLNLGQKMYSQTILS